MVLLFRLLKCLIVARLQRTASVFDQTRVTMRVWPNDLDFNVHANSGRYVSFMDVGRMAMLVRMRAFRKVVAKGWRPLVGGTMITYRKSLRPFEKFAIKSRIICWDEKWFYFEHIVVNSRGDLCAIGNVRGLLRGPDGNVRPQALLELAGRTDVISPPLPLFIKRWSEAEERA